MAKFTTDFLTWLKGLFYTETEVDNLLDKKINTVDVQGKITSFTNKDRINNERLTKYITTSGNPYLCFHDGTPSFEGLTKIGITDTTTETVYISGITGIGSNVTCTVKKIDGTVLGNATWDSTNSRYNYTFDGTILGVGIYYVYAEVTVSGSVWKSNILSVFVKENQNQMEYNVWSGTEYKNSLEDIYYIPNTINANPSNHWSSIGENSLHLKSTVERFQYTTLKQILVQQDTNLTVECDILHKTVGNIQLRIVEDNSNFNDVNIPVNNNPMHASVSKLITESKYINILLILRKNTDEAYIDNIKLTVS